MKYYLIFSKIILIILRSNSSSSSNKDKKNIYTEKLIFIDVCELYKIRTQFRTPYCFHMDN